MSKSYTRILQQRFTIFPKIEYTKEILEDQQDGQQHAYVLRIGKGADVRIANVMNPGGFKPLEPSISARICKRAGERLLGVVNADFFHMSSGAPQGATVMDGRLLKEEMRDNTHFFGIRHDGSYIIGDKETFGKSHAALAMAVCGRDILVDGENIPAPVLELVPDRHPRTAVGICGNGDLLLVVVDGRNPGVSEGMHLERFGLYLQSLGAQKALNLDGGGSSVMSVCMPGCQEAEIVNIPSDGAERPCANAIAIYAAQDSAYVTR